MFLVYLTVILIVLIMVTFVALLIIRLVKVMGSQIRRNAMRQLGRYANLLDQKSKELTELEQKISFTRDTVMNTTDLEEAGGEVITFPKIMKTASHMSHKFLNEYRCLRSLSNINCEQRLKDVIEKTKDIKSNVQIDRIDDVLNKLTGMALLEVLSVPQLEVTDKIQSICGSEVMTFVKEYRNMRLDEQIDIQDFIFYLKFLRKCNDATIYLETSEPCSINMKNVKVREDKTLLEGFVIKRYGKLYDFGLNRREIGL